MGVWVDWVVSCENAALTTVPCTRMVVSSNRPTIARSPVADPSASRQLRNWVAPVCRTSPRLPMIRLPPHCHSTCKQALYRGMSCGRVAFLPVETVSVLTMYWNFAVAQRVPPGPWSSLFLTNPIVSRPMSAAAALWQRCSSLGTR